MGYKTRHFLQTDDWSAFQKDIGNKPVKSDNELIDINGFIEYGRMANRVYYPYVKVSNKNMRAFTDYMHSMAKKQKLDFARADFIPDLDDFSSVEQLKRELADLGWRKAPSVQPENTAVSDLEYNISKLQDKNAMKVVGDSPIGRSDDELAIEATVLGKANQSSRQFLRKLRKLRIEFRSSNDPHDIHIFLNMIHDVAKRTGMQPHSDYHFREIANTLFIEKSAGLFIASVPKEVDDALLNTPEDKSLDVNAIEFNEGGSQMVDIAAIIYFMDDDTVYYAHAASYTRYRKLSPATALGFYAQIQAAIKGKRYFDWYGVAPKDADDTHPWSGFTKFKMAFGPEYVEYLGTWEYPVHNIFKQLKYALYRFLRHKMDNS